MLDGAIRNMLAGGSPRLPRRRTLRAAAWLEGKTVAVAHSMSRPSSPDSLEALKTAKAPDAKSVVLELDEADTSDGLTLGGEFIA